MSNPAKTKTVIRGELLHSLASEGPFDVLVIGGGIHGAVAAKIAALNGFKTALVERRDYASGTSSRSSKLAHGGLRYLELLDFKQVFEGIKAREDLFESVPHMVRPAPFLIPIPAHKQLFKYKLKAGLCLYDLLVRNPDRKHRWIPRSELPRGLFAEQGSPLLGCFQYTDGILDDGRLVIENILAARNAGALCLNYCAVTELDSKPDVANACIKDTLTQKSFQIQARVVLNCSGPWAPELNRKELEGSVVYSRGSHILFNRPWDHPCLFLPMRGKARYYFVLPHPGGTLVGTTEREVCQLEEDPLPQSDEIQEIYERLAKDLPNSGLTPENAHYCFAGVRTLPLRKPGTASPQLSRLHLWNTQGRMLTLLGGKYTTATWTALEGVRRATELAGLPALNPQIDIHRVAGYCTKKEILELQNSLQRELTLPAREAQYLVTLFGARCRHLVQISRESLANSPGAQEAQAVLCLREEQAETLEDLTRRRLNLEYFPDNGRTQLPALLALLNREKPEIDTQAESALYLKRMEKVANLLKCKSSHSITHY